MEDEKKLQEARMRLIETGGRTSQDLGTGRIVGQILIYLYLREDESSLDNIAEDLGLSKASVSIAVRQLEQLGLARKVWKSGDKRNYYKSAENIGKALQQGLLSLVRQKIQLFGDELEGSLDQIREIPENSPVKDDMAFLKQRIVRAKKLQSGLERVLGNPLVGLLAGLRGK
ncbi:MAG: MarR family transcriptional regulator [Proteobacteria bacterium]|nr:MarR family transcriptional regulator [Pseudomonadota bacterium]